MIFFCLTNLNDRYFAIYNYNWFIWILVQVFIIFAWFCFTKIANQCKWMHDAYIVLILFAHCMYIIHWNDCNNYILHIPDLIVSMIFIRDVAIAIWSEKKDWTHPFQHTSISCFAWSSITHTLNQWPAALLPYRYDRINVDGSLTCKRRVPFEKIFILDEGEC